MMERRNCSSNSSSNRNSNDDALYSYTLLSYIQIQWTYIGSLVVRLFVLCSLSIRTKKAEKKKRETERGRERQRDRKKNTTRGKKRKKEREREREREKAEELIAVLITNNHR